MQRFLTIGVFVTFLAANAAPTDKKRNVEKDLVVNVDLDEIPKEITIPIQGSKTLNGFNIDFFGTVRLRKQVSTASTPAPTFPPITDSTALTPTPTFPSMTDSDILDLMNKCGRGYYENGYRTPDIDGVKEKIRDFGPKQVVNARYADQTCLHYVAYYGHPTTITLLAENGADLNPKNYYRETPLRMAIIRGEHSSITTLIKFGADLEMAKESSYHQREFDYNMSTHSTKAAIAEGRRLAGQIG